jgi:serine/threonine-protein kinase
MDPLDTLLEDRAPSLLRSDASHRPGDTISARTLLALAGPDSSTPSTHKAVPTNPDEDLAALPRITLDTTGATAKSDYTLVAPIGEGGMGRVHLARERTLDRDVAIKTLRDDAPENAAHALLHEARLTGSLEHPGVIPVHALGIDDEGLPILVMKRVDGVDLSALLANPKHPAWSSRGAGSDPLSTALEILVHVCLTVELAHSRGVIHRDIKPENVMVGGFGEVYLLDWGIASTRDARKDAVEPFEPLVGTPAYMAPEMVLGGEIDERTDVYLLGATLHEILTGLPRHTGESVRAVLHAALASSPYAYGDDVPEVLAGLCNRATSRDPAERPPSARAFREELLGFQRRRSTQALFEVAIARLRALEELLASVPDAPANTERRMPSDLALVYRLATEARFGLTQSLGDGGDVAREGMQRCLAVLVDVELRQGHADTAEALLREMSEPREELAHRVAAIRERDAAGARGRKKLEILERDHDPSAQATNRTGWLLSASLAVATVWVAVAIRGGPPTAVWLLGASVASNAVTHFVLMLLRRSGGNRFNRVLTGHLALALGASLVNRVHAYVDHMPPAQTLTIDLVIFTIACAGSAIAILRSMWLVALVFVAGLAAIREWPEQGGRVFALTSVGALLMGAAVLARAVKKES